ncbi:MAG: helicase [Candidatus Viridilinea halotolerans]|uniref:Helicase n=1 Tax=Candidatus Viridilinea halotolerans TaxID=2491704 RepID=A0A426TQU8_9CHLR|nr:MAG: helicase [Candidatus Viridilinea halotolerans]
MAPFSPPEQGQLVEVRSRRYVVAAVEQSALPQSLLDPASARGAAQHLVTLASLEDDALGEELQVIWELEVGARVTDQRALPAPLGFDAPLRLDAFLDAVRWGAASSADRRALQSPFRAGIAIEDYQLDPVVRAIQMPRVNLLIADDVGLGKTIEAGLVIQELLIRHRARKVLIVCPAALQIQWRDQMREKFGLEFRIVDAELMRMLRRARGIHVNPWGHFPRLITSLDYLKRDQPMRLFRETLPASGELAYPRCYDLLIVDEAHNVAPSGVGNYAIDSLRTAAMRTLAPHFEHRLFLTATPHNGYAESFSALLELLDNQRFARGVPPDQRQLQSVMVRRLKAELTVDWNNRPRFPQRELHAIEVVYSDAERQAHRDLQTYTRLRRQQGGDTVERTATEFVLKLLKKRLLSSPAAFATTLAKHRNSLGAATRPERSATTRRPQVGILKALLAEIEEGYATEQEQHSAEEDAVATTTALFRPPTPEEEDLLERLSQWATSASYRPDQKARALLDWVQAIVRPNGQWSDERVIIFTEYRDTQKWLQGLLAAAKLTEGERLMLLYGGMQDDEREAVKAAFLASPATSRVRILLATDAASEGIDLQRHCHRLVHYEIPWNPNRMEQRNGRIDRHGQSSNPQIFHFAPAGLVSPEGSRKDAKTQRRNVSDSDLGGFAPLRETPTTPVGELEGDLEFLMRAVLKVEQIREDLGKVGPVIAEQVVEAMIGTRQQLDTSVAERKDEPARRMVKFERDLNAQIKQLYAQLQESRHTLHLTPEHVEAVVHIALELADQPPLAAASLAGVWPDPTGERLRCPVFHLPPLRGSWGQCAVGLEHPHTRQVRPITFDHEIAKGRDDVVLVHLNHRLVQLAMRLLRAEVWSGEGRQKLHRVTARVIPDHIATNPLVLVYGRLVVIGGDSYRLHEELIVAGGEISQGRFRRFNVGQVQQASAALSSQAVSEAMQQELAALWPAISAPLQRSIEARANERTASLQRLIDERREQELTDITCILAELTQTITNELAAAEQPIIQQALPLAEFSPAEREQYRRNLEALRLRLAQIPRELEQETRGIAARYADPQARLFPAAVMFLVPRRLA